MKVGSRSLTRRDFWTAGAGLTGAAFVSSFGFNRLAEAAVSDETITQIARFKLNLDKEEEAIEALKELCAAVEDNEPGVLAYICHRSAEKPEELVFFEIYENPEAIRAHGQTPHLGKLRSVFASLFLPPLEITRLNRVGGFARHGEAGA